MTTSTFDNFVAINIRIFESQRGDIIYGGVFFSTPPVLTKITKERRNLCILAPAVRLESDPFRQYIIRAQNYQSAQIFVSTPVCGIPEKGHPDGFDCAEPLVDWPSSVELPDELPSPSICLSPK